MIGIIGGTGVYEIMDNVGEITKKVVETPFDDSPEVSLFKLNGVDVAFIPRHMANHNTPPHMINYRANIWALKELGVKKIIATNSVGSLDLDLGPGSIVIPDDFIDFTKMRTSTFYDDSVVHIDVTHPYCDTVREALISSGDVHNGGVYVCTEGPRFETSAEIRMFQKLGGTVVGMTGLPEAVLARELEMCYASVCLISNYGAGISDKELTVEEVFEIMDSRKDELVKLIRNAVSKISFEDDCYCQHALDDAEI